MKMMTSWKLLSEEGVEQQFSGETSKLESVAEWPVNITRDESSVGGQDDLPIEKHEELQSNGLHKENQLMKQLEEVIHEIRELMLRSAEEVVSKENMERGAPTRAIGKMKMQQ
jgi:hypothetical protein